MPYFLDYDDTDSLYVARHTDKPELNYRDNDPAAAIEGLRKHRTNQRLLDAVDIVTEMIGKVDDTLRSTVTAHLTEILGLQVPKQETPTDFPFNHSRLDHLQDLAREAHGERMRDLPYWGAGEILWDEGITNALGGAVGTFLGKLDPMATLDLIKQARSALPPIAGKT